MIRSTTPFTLGLTLDHLIPHQPLQPLTNGGRGYPHLSHKSSDGDSSLAPQKIQYRFV